MHPTRRAFCRTLALSGLALAGCGKDRSPQASQEAPGSPSADSFKASRPGKSQVVVVRDPRSLAADGTVDVGRLRGMLDQAMLTLTEAGSVDEAWGQFVQPEDVVAIKLNALAGPELSSHPELSLAIAENVRRAGVREERIVIYDRTTQELETLGLKPNLRGRGLKIFGNDAVGYDLEPTVVKSVGTCFTRIVSEMATALINVPVLKDHDLAGLSGALKNHYGSIHNPNKLHLNHCYPYIADLNCAEALLSKQRLVVFDALRVCYEGGPAFQPDTTVNYGALLVTTDPVAADAVGLGIIEGLRKEAGLDSLMTEDRAPRYIELAASYGLGNHEPDKIEVVEV